MYEERKDIRHQPNALVIKRNSQHRGMKESWNDVLFHQLYASNSITLLARDAALGSPDTRAETGWSTASDNNAVYPVRPFPEVVSLIDKLIQHALKLRSTRMQLNMGRKVYTSLEGLDESRRDGPGVVDRDVDIYSAKSRASIQECLKNEQEVKKSR